MTRDSLINEYFEWMYQLVHHNRYSRKASYRKLLSRLYSIDFTYTIDMDNNRASDGINLRYRFGYECDHPDYEIAAFLDDRPCSVLEMMLALAIRCEESITCDQEKVGKWFWSMLRSLGLDSMNDDSFDRDYVDEVIDIFLNREYSYDGKGGLFTIENPKRDLRTVEIWYQMSWYLNTIVTI